MIRFTNHALIKLAQRNISREFVEETVENPDYAFDTYGSRQAMFKRFEGKFLKVIVVEDAGVISIITEHWDSTFKPDNHRL